MGRVLPILSQKLALVFQLLRKDGDSIRHSSRVSVDEINVRARLLALTRDGLSMPKGNQGLRSRAVQTHKKIPPCAVGPGLPTSPLLAR